MHDTPITAVPGSATANMPDAAGDSGPVLAVEDLHVNFAIRDAQVPILRGVTLHVGKGEIVGLVGESGSGKSVTGLTAMRLLDRNGSVAGGRVLFRGDDLLQHDQEYMRALRGDRMAMIFQDPLMTLNPVLRIDTQMLEALTTHYPAMPREEARQRCLDALVKVGIPAPEERLETYPHQLSGGMRQRIAIAIAMLNRPDLIIADEPTTALDVTIQAQILYEMQQLCRESSTALLWITHDLSVVAGLADRVYVMYSGKIVESGTVDDVLDKPMHPYTRGLIMSSPGNNEPGKPLFQIPGMAPIPAERPCGCAFRPRCPRADGQCESDPVETSFACAGGGDHTLSCFHPYEYSDKGIVL
ncbi:ABC transporter ATP-binding protein [Desulfovibrio sp. OttesenSCG-928-I05]|nr:ABC transporter ATP-binding protein [Desulfovibrio sp. OttesenSCG-928-I05]